MYVAETEKSVKNIVVDDMILTTDMPTSAGSKMLDGYISLFEAQAVTNLKEAGYTVYAKANTGEFNLDLLGETSFYGAVETEGKLTTAAAQAVKAGDSIVIVEAMKMEIPVVAPQDGTVASIEVAAGDAVENGSTLATLN